MSVRQVHETRLRVRALTFAHASAFCAAGIGFLALLGWWLHFFVLDKVYDLLPATTPNCAVGLILTGFALFAVLRNERPAISSRRIAMGTSLAAIVLAGLVLGEYATHRDLHVDRLWIGAATGSIPVRMPPTGAFCLFVIAAALLLLTIDHWIPLAQWMGLLATLVGILAITGYAFAIKQLYTIGANTPMSAEMAVMCTVLGIGVLCARPDSALMNILISPNVGGIVARRLLPIGIGFPFLIALLQEAVLFAHLGRSAYGQLITLVLLILLLTVPVLWTAALLFRTDRQRERAERHLAAQYSVARILAGDGAAHTLSQPVLEVVCSHLQWDAAVLWEAEATDEAVGISAAWPLAGNAPPLTLAPECVRDACREGRSRWLEQTNLAEGYSTSAIFPILLQGRATGAIQCFSHSPRQRDDELAKVMEGVNSQIAQFIERKRTERAVRHLHRDLQEHASKLQAANKELEAFSYSVSHDLRAPLRHIAGFVQLLEKRASGSLDEQSRRYIGVINGACSKMGELVDDLLSFSRMGRAEMLRARVDLNVLVRQVIQDLAPACADRRVDWSVATFPPVDGDTAMIRVVLTNFLSNAVKYTMKRDLAKIEVGVGPSDTGDVVVYVRDNGAGFDMKYSGKLFGVFQRLHRDEEFEGTGIGLATARRIIHRHGGRTWAEGVPDQGATFYFSLPEAMRNKLSA